MSYNPNQPHQHTWGQQPVQQPSWGQPAQQPYADSNPSCRQLIVPQTTFQHPNYRPPYPVFNDLPQDISNYIPQIAVAVGNFLNQQALANPAYTYYYNLVAQNNYANPVWEELVRMTLLNFIMVMKTGQMSSQDQAFGFSVTFMVKGLAAKYAVSNPIVFQSLSPVVQQDVQGLVGTLQNAWNQISNVLQQMQNQQMRQPSMFMQAQNQQPPQSNTVASFWNNSANMAPKQEVTYDPLGGPGTTYRGRYANGQQPPVQNYTQAQTSPAAPVAATQQYTQAPTSVASAAPVAPANTGAPTAADWKGTPYQRLHPAFNRHTSIVKYAHMTAPNGTIYVRATVEPKPQKNPTEGNQEMQRSDHLLSTVNRVFQKKADEESKGPRMDSILRDMELAAKALQAAAVQEDAETTERFQNLSLMDVEEELTPGNSLTELVDAARICRLEKQNGGDTIFSAAGPLNYRFITREDFTDFFNELRSCNNLSAIAAKMREMIDAEESSEAIAMIGRLDRYLSGELLSVLNRRLGMPYFSFDSFIEDIEAIYTAIEKDWGDNYIENLKRFEPSFIASLFGKETLQQAGLVHPKDPNRVIGYQVSSSPTVSVTLLDVDNAGLGLELRDGSAESLLSSNFPGFFSFMEQILKSYDFALHYYVVTADDVVYEIARSIGGDPISISYGPAI